MSWATKLCDTVLVIQVTYLDEFTAGAGAGAGAPTPLALTAEPVGAEGQRLAVRAAAVGGACAGGVDGARLLPLLLLHLQGDGPGAAAGALAGRVPGGGLRSEHVAALGTASAVSTYRRASYVLAIHLE